MSSVAIVNVGCGNIGSLFKALDKCFDEVTVADKPSMLDSIDYVFLPGSGSAGVFKEQLVRHGFEVALRDIIQAGRPVIGICLGFQLLFNGSDEDGGVEGFGYFNGQVSRVTHLKRKTSRTGWYESDGGRSWMLEADRNFFYFNHAFGVAVNDFSTAVPHGVSDSVISWAKGGNVAGFQFHPEKSQYVGHRLFQSIARSNWLA